MLYKDGQPVAFSPPGGSSPFATESIEVLKKKGTIRMKDADVGKFGLAVKDFN